MKLVSFEASGQARWGHLLADEQGVIDIPSRWPQFPTLRSALAANALDAVRTAGSGGPDYHLAEVRLLPVVPDPAKIICVGLNYRDHREEAQRPATDWPTLFTRFADSQTGAGAVVNVPQGVEMFDYEGEVAVVIGRPMYHVRAAQAMSGVAGLACYNDFTARDWQRHSSQWTAGKNFPGTGAFGPMLVTLDELGEVEAMRIETRVNGELRQSATLGDLVFPVPALLEYICRFTPLSPGDVIVTGTPSGVGAFRNPPVFLQPGDVVDVAATGLGVLRNVVARAQG